MSRIAISVRARTDKVSERGNFSNHDGVDFMDKKAWVHQLKKHVETKGEDKAAWYVTWNDPEGNRRTQSCGPGKIGRSSANKLADTIHSQLVTGTYNAKTKKTWEFFRGVFKSRIADRMDVTSREACRQSLDAFERVGKPKLLLAITSASIEKFITERFKDPGIRGATLSAATVNKDLRYIKMVMNYAEEWGLISKVPRIRFLKQSQNLPTYVPPDHFAAIYQACETAMEPNDVPNVVAADWWRGVLVTAYMTGWRIGQILALKWSDVDAEANTITIRANVTGNKGKREERIPLHPAVAAQLKLLEGSFDSHVFPWNRDRRELWPIFQAIQLKAILANKKPMPKSGKGGGWYGFHDLRRAFATLNAGSMDLFELQALMQHKTLATTQGYVNMSKRLQKPVDNLFVPTVLKVSKSG